MDGKEQKTTAIAAGEPERTVGGARLVETDGGAAVAYAEGTEETIAANESEKAGRGVPESGQNSARTKKKISFFESIKGGAKNLLKTKNLTVLAVMSALSFVLYAYAKFPLPIFPGFLDFQFSDLPIVMAGFITNPGGAAVVAFVRYLLKLPMSGTGTVGELGDLLLGLTFALTASIIFHRRGTKRSAMIGLIAGTVAGVFVAVLVNMFILVPFYVHVSFNGDWSRLTGMLSVLYGAEVTKANFFLYYIFLAVIPFNIMRFVISAAMTFFLYRALAKSLSYLFPAKKKEAGKAV